MSYLIESFDGVALPLFEVDQEIGAGRAVVPRVRRVDGGVFAPSPSLGQWLIRADEPITLRGELIGTHAERQTQERALWGLRGRDGQLVRREFSSDTTHSILATCIEVRARHVPDYCQYQPIDFSFYLNSDCWNGAPHDITETITLTGITYEDELPLMLVENTEAISGELITVTNGGNAYQPHFVATLTVGGSDPVGVIGIRNYTTGHWWPWIDTGNPALPGERVRFDSGRLTAELLDSGGTVIRNLWRQTRNFGTHSEWFALAPGDNDIEAGFGDASGTGFSARFEYYDGWM